MNKTTEALKLAGKALGCSQQHLDLYHPEWVITRQQNDKALAAIREVLAESKPAPDGRIPKTVFTLDDISKAAEMGRQAGMIDALAEQALQKLSDFHQYMEATEPVKQEPVAWINEDELPEHYPYEEMFNASTIIDGVRMFPNVKMSDRSMFYGLTKDHTWLSVTESQFNKLKPEKRMKCYLTPVDAKAIRAEALEEAAKWCEAKQSYSAMHANTEFAAGIRWLK